MIVQNQAVVKANPQWPNVSVKPDGTNAKKIAVTFTLVPPEFCQQQQLKSGAEIISDLLKGLGNDILKLIGDALSLVNPGTWLKPGGIGQTWDDLVDHGVDVAKKIWDAFHARTIPPAPTKLVLTVPVIELDPNCLTGYGVYVTCKGHLKVEGSGPTETAGIRTKLSWNGVSSTGSGVSSSGLPFDHDETVIDELHDQSGELAHATVAVEVTLTATSAGDFGSKPQPISRAELSSVVFTIEDNCPGH
jgi:hypothetical protein